MNPLTGSIKYFISSIYNSLMALMFYILLARYLTPSYLGEIALVQLIAALVTSVFAIMPTNLITREVSHDTTAGKGLALAEVSLMFPAIVFPALLIFLIFPSYVWVSLPYFLLTIFTFYQASVLSGLGKFTEANVGQIISSTFRYGLAIVGVLMRNVYMIIIFWTLGTVAAAIYYGMKIRVRPRWHMNEFKSVTLTGLPIYLSGIVTFIAGQGDRVVTYALLGSFFLGIYQLMAMISTVPNLLINSFSSAILPASTHYYVKGKDMAQMSSLTFRLYAIISLPLALAGYALAYPVISRLFPAYLPGTTSLELLILFVTATMPFQSLSMFMIAAKKNYKPFIVIGIMSAVEVVGVSYALIPRLSVLGAAIAQSTNAVLTSVLLILFSAWQGVFVMDRKNALTSVLIIIALLGFFSWEIALVVVLVGIKLAGIIEKDDVRILVNFAPTQLKRLVGLLGLLAS